MDKRATARPTMDRDPAEICGVAGDRVQSAIHLARVTEQISAEF
jgi:hypothetical protein